MAFADFSDWHVEPTRGGFAVVRYERGNGGLYRYVYSPDGEAETIETEGEATSIARRMRGTLH